MMSEIDSSPRSDPHVTDTELSVLEALWRFGESTIRTLPSELYPGGGAARYATVQKLLERLETKGFVTRRREGRIGLFRARIDRGELIRGRLQATADRLCGGALSPLLTHLVEVADARALAPDDIASLRRLVARLSDQENAP
jgi:predicted transcriptional regulator